MPREQAADQINEPVDDQNPTEEKVPAPAGCQIAVARHRDPARERGRRSLRCHMKPALRSREPRLAPVERRMGIQYLQTAHEHHHHRDDVDPVGQARDRAVSGDDDRFRASGLVARFIHPNVKLLQSRAPAQAAVALAMQKAWATKCSERPKHPVVSPSHRYWRTGPAPCYGDHSCARSTRFDTNRTRGVFDTDDVRRRRDVLRPGPSYFADRVKLDESLRSDSLFSPTSATICGQRTLWRAVVVRKSSSGTAFNGSMP